jgi:3-deoxy-7-phosphoheptulonate synthase
MIIDTTNEQTQNDKIKNYLISRNINFKEVELYEKNLLITSAKITKSIFKDQFENVKVLNFDTEYQLSTRKFKQHNTEIKLTDDIIFGTNKTVMMAGPCSVENKDQTFKAAEYLKDKHNIKIFRAGAFKPRTSPYTFQGLKDNGLKILDLVRDEFDVKIITEVKDSTHLKEVSEVADIIQIGTKAMFDFSLLEMCGKINKPILLKRGFMATVKEFLQCADFIISNGNCNVILCERGVRTFETITRFSLDICSAAVLKKISHLPLVLDPSHAIGLSEYVGDIAVTASALGIDGLLVETHPNPEQALSDKDQALSFEQFTNLYSRVDKICKAVDRNLI